MSVSNNLAYPHYFKDVAKYAHIDVYRVLQLWQVDQPALQHAIKKLLVAGKRGSKGFEVDCREAIASIERALQMHREDSTLMSEGSFNAEVFNPPTANTRTHSPFRQP